AEELNRMILNLIAVPESKIVHFLVEKANMEPGVPKLKKRNQAFLSEINSEWRSGVLIFHRACDQKWEEAPASNHLEVLGVVNNS
ncbi:hypothetical protein JW964_19190, partial [candidate division KSB1 bacterium]|nr:hypothetical protein [candidate division KSB1 bacterium]